MKAQRSLATSDGKDPAVASMPRWVVFLAGAATLVLSGLIVVNTIPYFSFGSDFAFLAEKGQLAHQVVWNTCFYTHLSGGLLCLILGPLLLWNGLSSRSRRIHRWMGRVYALAVLGWAGPAGVYLALHSKGGTAGQTAFLILVLLWMGATARAIHAIRVRCVAAHKRWVLRSYTLTLSAVFFRVFQSALFLTAMDDELNYQISLWLSLGASLVAGEMIIHHFGLSQKPSFLKGGLP